MSAKITVDQAFESRKELADAVNEYAIEFGVEHRVKRASKTRYELTCRTADCPWRLYASPVGASSIWIIRTLTANHTCFGPASHRNLRATSAFVATQIANKVRRQPNYRPVDIVNDIQEEHGVKISCSKAWRAKEIATSDIVGSHEEAYSNLPAYAECLLASNPGSSVVLDCTPDNRFHRIFLCYKANASSFRYCKPLFGLDGAHMRSKYKVIPISR